MNNDYRLRPSSEISIQPSSHFQSITVYNLILFNSISIYSSLIDIKPNILAALKSQGPVVALESTIITHGMPYPYNLETAAEVEGIIRQEVCNEHYKQQKRKTQTKQK